ncbi:hypothetical protein AYL99_00191 [Fonsecaea erecta]|uniref:JmjC domain-containing protein n=1 Tax=Fonsecaea erecta TaxID=1367422 RepID=A0A178ZWL8_9EURO|nr:hypothetical protein AYL99_00191 [Fonsecaea erecta]OAP64219.1 hypothetical protein AYL99_00191 [Fonsecaea erecta]
MPGAKTKNTAKDFALTTLLTLIEDYHSFNPETTVPTYAYPTYLEFSQQIARGRPCVYRLDRSVLDDDDDVRNGSGEVEAKGESCNGSEEDPKPPASDSVKRRRLRQEQRSVLSAPCFRWTKKSLCELVPDEVEVAVTPDGRADALYSLPRRGKRPDAVEGGSGEDQGNGKVGDRGVEREMRDLAQKGMSGHEEEGEETETETEQVFLQPATTQMTLASLIDKLCPPQPSSQTILPTTTNDPVYYLQSQNSNLHTPPLSSLLHALPRGPPPFSANVLGAPEAVNIWIGNARSVTSTHRDPYENLYLVVKGRKRFVLYSPVEEVCLHAQRVRTGRWEVVSEGDDDDDQPPRCRKRDRGMRDGNGDGGDGQGQQGRKKGQFRIVMDDDAEKDWVLDDDQDTTNCIPWIPIDPLAPPPAPSTRYPYYKHARPLTVTVSEGEILYLPAGWFHHVSQECGVWESDEGDGGESVVAPCIAVNYWFDMDYSGEKHVMREMVGRLVEKTRTND